MKGLFIRDVWLQHSSIALAIAIVLLPIILAINEDVVPNRYSVWGMSTNMSVGVVVGATPTSVGEFVCNAMGANRLNINMTMFLRGYGWFLNHLSILYFMLSGMIVAIAVARPLEMKYFFIELTFAGSRVKLLLSRLASVTLLLLVSAASSALALSAILYTAIIPGGLYTALGLSLLISIGSALLSIPIATLLSLSSKNTTLSIFGLLGFVALCLVVSQKFDVAKALISIENIVEEPGTIFVVAPVQFILFTIDVIEAGRVGY
ncbi:MAG: hypothetical protein QW348_01635 [Ignisphaera sp.]